MQQPYDAHMHQLKGDKLFTIGVEYTKLDR